MIFGLNFLEDLLNLSLFIYQEGHAVITQVLSAHEFLLTVSPKTF